MKLLLDANLSWRLIGLLATPAIHVEHVNRAIQPAPASDEKIWNYARLNGFTIVTRDYDFVRLFETRGAPPAVIVIRHQNRPWRSYGDLIRDKLAEIQKAIVDEKLGLVEIH